MAKAKKKAAPKKGTKIKAKNKKIVPVGKIQAEKIALSSTEFQAEEDAKLNEIIMGKPSKIEFVPVSIEFEKPKDKPKPVRLKPHLNVKRNPLAHFGNVSVSVEDQPFALIDLHLGTEILRMLLNGSLERLQPTVYRFIRDSLNEIERERNIKETSLPPFVICGKDLTHF